MLYKLSETHKRYILIDTENGLTSPVFGWKYYTCLKMLKSKDYKMIASILFSMTEIDDEDVVSLNNLILNAELTNGRYGYQKKYTKKTGRPKKNS